MIDDSQEIAKKLYGNRLRVRVCGICIEDGKILLVNHRGVISSQDVWLPPGGGLEAGETITACLEREFLEETGLVIEVEKFLFKREFIHLPLHAIELFFQVKVQSGELRKGTDPELDEANQLIKDLRWIPIENKTFLAEDLYLAINA